MEDTSSIVEEIRQNREKGSARLVVEYRDRLYAAALSLCGDAAKSEDLVFATFESVLDKIDMYSERDAFYGWMYTIMLNHYRKSVRGRMVKNTVPMGGSDDLAAIGPQLDANTVIAAIDGDIVRAAVDHLPPKLRDMVVLHYFMDMPLWQIAKFLTIPIGTVQRRLYMARKVLAIRLGAKLKKPAVAMIAAGLMLLGATAAVVVGVDALAAPESGGTRSVASEMGGTRSVASETGGTRSSASSEIPSDENPPTTANQPPSSNNQSENEKGETKMTIKQKAAAALAATIAIGAAVADTTYTSASYVQDGLITQWDGIDNVGTGTHDPTTNIWKDLKGNNDLTIVAGRGSEWRRGIGLYISNIALGKAAAYGSETAKTYKTIEIVYKMTATGGRIMFWGGDQTRYVVFDKEGDQFNYVYFDGKKTTAYSRVHCYVPTSIVATYDDNNTVTDIYCDGAEKVTDTMRNTWNPGDNYVTLGWRSVNNAGANYGWEGEIYAIRLYNRVLTPEELAKNNAIDTKRFFTTAMYDTDGLISFWDAKDNVGEGSHDSTSAIWKNLVSGGQNLTPSNSHWSDNALVCNGSNQSGAYGTETMEYKTLEVLFRNERNANTWLFSNGINRYCVLGMWRTQWQNWCGVKKSHDLSFSRSYFGKHSLSWISSDPSGSNAAPFVDGIRQEYHYNTAKPSSESNGGGKNGLDDWGAGGAFVQVGGRSTGSQNFKGNMYAVRAYSTAVTQEKVWQNNKIDTVRYANALRWNGGNGSFGTAGNWRDVDVTTAVPGVDNTVDLTMGTYKITLDQDQTVGAMRARNGHISYAPSCIDATVDMGGNTLTVLDGYQAEAYKGANDNRFARLNLTNGVFNAESVQIGALSDRIPDDYDTWINYLPAFTIGSGSLCLDGLVTTGAIRKAVQLEGAHTKLHVAGGANLSCDKLNVYGVQDGSDRAQVEFTGMGTVATINGLWITRDVDMTISDGANVTLTGCSEYLSSGGCWASSIGRSFASTYGNSSRMVVDNATFTITFRAVDDVMYLQGFAVGAAYKAKGGSGTSVTLQNNARLSLTGTGRFFVGIANDRSDADSKNCVLNVLDGSTFDGASTKLEVGANGDTSFCGVNVSNATVNCNVVYFGSVHSVTASSNDFLNVSGAAARINIASADTDSLKLRMGAQLKFTLPENGFAATPIVTAGGVTVYDDENNVAVDPVKLVIDGTAFNGSEQTLIECATDSTAAFQKLIANHTGWRKGRLLITDGGTKLVYVKSGTRIVIR